MAEKKDVQRLVGRAVLEPEFARALLMDPLKAAEAEGIKLSSDESEALKISAVEFVGAADAIDRGMKRVGRVGPVYFVDISKH